MNELLQCIYCGAKDDLTRDHVPPKNLFIKPYPPNLLTVPACKDCNESYTLDDEYFRIAVSAEANRNKHPMGSKIWWDKVFGSTLVRSPKLKSVLAENISRVKRKIYNDRLLKNIPILNMDANRVNNILKKITKGLLWHHFQCLLPQKIDALVWMNPPFPDQVTRLLLNLKLERPHPHIFSYRYGLVKDIPNASIWGMQFYENTHFLIMMNTQDKQEND